MKTTSLNQHIKGSNGRPILYDAYTPSNNHPPLLIFCHGFKGFKDWGAWSLLAQSLSDMGCMVVLFNFSHNGCTPKALTDFDDLEAFGQNTHGKELWDLQLLIDHLYDTYTFDAQKVVLCGHSKGGGTAIIHAAIDRRITHLVSLASIADFRERLPYGEKEQQWKKLGVIYIKNGRTGQDMPLYYSLLKDLEDNKEERAILRHAAQLKIPYLLLHGDQDQAVDLSNAKRIKNAYPKAQLEVIQGANHVFGASHPYTEKELPIELKQCIILMRTFLSLPS